MSFVLRIISNFFALYLADLALDGLIFYTSARPPLLPEWFPVSDPIFFSIALAAVFLTLLNMLLRPLLKFLFGPVILLTLGLFTFAINAAMLYILDVLLAPLVIQDTETLIIATVIMGVVNLIFGIFEKSKKT